MTDFGLEVPAPPEPAGAPAGPVDAAAVGALLGQPLIPPAPAELIADLAQDRPAPPDLSGGITSKDRLLVGHRLTAPLPPATPAPAVTDSAAALTGKQNPLNQKNVQLAARLAQLRDMAPDPDATEAAVQRLANSDILVGRQKELFDRLKGGDGLDEEEWAEASEALLTVAQTLGEVSEDLKVGTGRVVAVESQQGTGALQVEFPLTDRIDDLPLSTTGDSFVLPAYTLDRPAKDFTVFVTGPEVSYAAPADPQVDQQLRNLFPGPLGKDGIPRWVPVEPLKVTNHSAVQAIPLTAPGVEMDGYLDREAYVGTRPGDWIVFDVPDASERPGKWLPPAWAQGRLEQLRGGVNRSVPEVSLAPVRRDDLIDGKAAADRLADHAWAVLPPLGDPKRTARMLGAVKAAGYEPVEVERSDGRKSWLVFGMPGDQAADLAAGRTVYTHAGQYGTDDGTDLPSWNLRTRNGDVTEVLAVDEVATGAVPRTQKRATRLAFKVDPQQVKYMAGLAKDLEVSGASNVSLYTRGQVEGFEQAREYLFDDGITLKAARTRASRIGDSNAIPVLVRSAAGLPAEAPEVAPNTIDWSGTEFADDGRRLTVEAGQDLVKATRDAAVLSRIVGGDRVRVVGPDGEIKLHRPA